MAIKQYATLSTTEPNNEVGIIKIRQADEETQTLVAEITENGVPKDFIGYQPFFCAKLGQAPGLGIIEQPVTVSTPAEGKLEYTFQSADWQKVGRQTGYFVFRNAQGQQFSTRDFYFTVIKSVYSDGITEVKTDGSTYIWTFEDMQRRLDEYVATGKTDWENFVEQNREILESVDPGGTILLELLDARKNGENVTYESLSARLNAGDASVKALKTEVEEDIKDIEEDLARAKIELKDVSEANSNGYLRLPVYNNAKDFQATHPSVLYFADGFAGVKWWMAFTPYEASNEWLENPSVLCSDDGINWRVPTGAGNPLVVTNDGNNMHHSDTHLIYVNNRLECWYRRSYRGTNPLREEICRRTTTDGATWTAEEILYGRDGTVKELLCPVVNYLDGKYCIWLVNASDNYFEYFESTDGTNWQNHREIPFPTHPLDATILPWHFDIKRNNGVYELYYNGGVNDIGTALCYATSTDNVTYTWKADVMHNRPGNFDSYRIYRPSILDIGDTRYIYYGGSDVIGRWYIGITRAFVSKPDQFYGMELFVGDGKVDKLAVGDYTYLTETELKMVKPGVSDVRLQTDETKPGVWLVKQGLGDATPYGGMLMNNMWLWDAPLNDASKHLRVENKQLIYFDGQYPQRVAITYMGGTADRPSLPPIGSYYFDTQLHKPVWFDGTQWVDAQGIIS